jgi:exodeoxyribonuclease VII small subunit
MPSTTKPPEAGTPPMPPSPLTGKSFDDGLAELEAIVARLESGELTLEVALAEFEAGIALVRALNQHLNEAEARIDVLTRDANGLLRLQPMERTREGNG